MVELKKEQVKDAIFIDVGAEVLYGHDQANVTYPCVFPTVNIELTPSDILCQLADKARAHKGGQPIYPNGCDAHDDDIGWYNFYVGLNGYTTTKVDTCISVTAIETGGDCEGTFYIDIDDDAQREVFNVLDAQLKKTYGKGCDQMLKEAEDEMNEKRY